MILVGVLMTAQQGFRNYGFALSRDSTVVVVLYAEIIFSFIWGMVFLRESCQAVMYDM